MLRRMLVFAWLAGAPVAVACGDSGDGGDGGGDDDCAEGSQGCACYGNGTCDGTLQCDGTKCVAGGQGGSSGSAATGGTGGTGATGGSTTGGAPTGGSAGSTAGVGGSSSGQGGTTQGGTSGTATGGNAGAATGGSAGTCGDTSSDPMNCGQCGRSCNGSCVNGQCSPYMAGCFDGDDGFATCAAYCASIGETCVSNSCGAASPGGMTIAGWANTRPGLCESDPGSSNSSGQGACDAAINFRTSFWFVRCCCSDSQ